MSCEADDKGPVIPQAAAELCTAGAEVKPLGVGETLGCTSPKVGNVDAVGSPKTIRNKTIPKELL